MKERVLSVYESKKRPGVTIKVIHKKSALPLIQDVVRGFRPRLIIELGHAAGGLTMLFHDAAPKAFIRAFDTRKAPSLSDEQVECFNARVAFIQADVLRSSGNTVVLNYLAWSQRTLLYCDNGNKTLEVEMYAPYLQVDDMLGVHDWPSGADAKILTPLLDRLGFEPHRHDDFENVGMSRFWIRRRIT